ncbi:hypothetical protein Tco_0802871 [Tanacetum coccineum]|uniref:Uncharacterized protein n=1 Tax=Tanacetum coccineum TaxID=301880 RepID=A0ABQ5A4E2_9ASTR
MEKLRRVLKIENETKKYPEEESALENNLDKWSAIYNSSISVCGELIVIGERRAVAWPDYLGIQQFLLHCLYSIPLSLWMPIRPDVVRKQLLL